MNENWLDMNKDKFSFLPKDETKDEMERFNPEISDMTPAVRAAMGALNSSGSGFGRVGSGLTSIGMLSGNHFLTGGGLGLTAIGAISDSNKQDAQSEYKAEMEEYSHKVNAINRLANWASRIKEI